jgi:hypothetical protein
MKLTKEKLQELCQIINIPTSGSKQVLQKRICETICSTNTTEKAVKASVKITTLRGLIRYNKSEKMAAIAADIKEMLDDDSSEESIVKSLSKLHNVKIEKIDVIIFAELDDAANKKDYDFITEKIEEWGTKAKYGIELIKANTKDHKLLDAINK